MYIRMNISVGKKRGPRTSESSPLLRVNCEAILVVESYQSQTSLDMREVVEAMEDDVLQTRQGTHGSEVEVEMSGWIPDTCLTRTRDTKYYRIINLYWHIKDLLGSAITEK
jgi:hypothetical protein